MKALKLVLVFVPSILFAIIVCVILRPEPCSHVPCTHDPGPRLVTMAEFQTVMTARTSLWDAQRKNNEASLLAVQVLQKGSIQNAKAIQQNTVFIKQTVDDMVGLAKVIKKLAESK